MMANRLLKIVHLVDPLLSPLSTSNLLQLSFGLNREVVGSFEAVRWADTNSWLSGEFYMNSSLANEPLMKPFSQCGHVNTLERLLGLIRIIICLCNYTLSTGNTGHYPTAPLDLHDISWSRTVSRRAASSSCNQTRQYLYPFPFQRNAPQIPDVSFISGTSWDPLSGSPESA